MPSEPDGGAASVTGGLLGRLADRLRLDGRDVGTASSGLADTWTGPASLAARRRLRTLTEGSSRLAVELERASTAFQTLATETAEVEAALRRVRSRASVAGLLVDDVGVHHRPGLRAVADPAAELRLETTREALDAEHAALRTRSATAVAALLAALDPTVAEGVAAACRG